jgi:exopolysaccharide production protein ExoZ
MQFGAAGVDVFFVISGFIMWSITAARPPSPARFLRDRITRIVPLYALTTLLLAVAATAIPGMFPRLRFDTGYVLASLLFVPVRSPFNSEIAPLLTQGWSLNYEMFFYVMFALALLLPARFRLPVLSTTLLGLALVGFFYSSPNPIIFTYTDPRLLEFLAGLILGWLYTRQQLPGRTWGWLSLGGGVVFGLVSATELVVMPAVIAWGIPATLLVAGLVTLEVRGGIATWPFLTVLGDASYSIYLTHGFALSVTRKFVGEQNYPAVLVLGSLASIVLGLVVWRYLERPITNALKDQRRVALAT